MISMTDPLSKIADLWRHRGMNAATPIAATMPNRGSKQPFDALAEARTHFETADKRHAAAAAALAALDNAADGQGRIRPERPYRAAQLTATAVAAACLWPGLAGPPALALVTAVLGGAAAVRLADRLGRVGRRLRHQGTQAALAVEGLADAAALAGVLLVIAMVGGLSAGSSALLVAGLATAATAGWLRQDPKPDRPRLARALDAAARERGVAEQALRDAIEAARARLASLADGLEPATGGE